MVVVYKNAIEMNGSVVKERKEGGKWNKGEEDREKESVECVDETIQMLLSFPPSSSFLLSLLFFSPFFRPFNHSVLFHHSTFFTFYSSLAFPYKFSPSLSQLLFLLFKESFPSFSVP